MGQLCVSSDKLGAADKSVAFKVPTSGTAKAITWWLMGADTSRAIILDQLGMTPGQEITATLGNGGARLELINDGPDTSAVVKLGGGTTDPVSIGSVPLPAGQSGFDCAWGPSSPTCATLPLGQEAIFGFESSAAWTLAPWMPPTPLELVNSIKTEGRFALQVGGSGFRELTSKRFSTSILHGITSNLSVDVYMPSAPSNAYWTGAVQMYADCPSAGIYHAYIGQVELTGRPLGAFTTARFALPGNVVAAMQSAHSDFALGIVINAAPAEPNYVLDNLRFTQ